MTGVQIPLSLGELTGTLVGLAAWSWFVAQWTKNALPDWRWTNWVTLAIVAVTSVLGTLIMQAWAPTAEQVMWSILLAVMATSMETWGYEAVANGIGAVLGKGPRSDAALETRARLTVLGPRDA